MNSAVRISGCSCVHPISTTPPLRTTAPSALPCPRSARKRAGYDLNLLDAYVTGNFDVGGIPLSVRVGDQVINWGESVFIRNGLNSINPVDSSKVRVAGAEVRDVLEPVTAANIRLGLTDNLSLESFYQLRWVHTELEPAGTFFSTSDSASPGADTVHIGFGVPGRSNDNAGAADPACPLSPAPVYRAHGTGMQTMKGSSAWHCVISHPC